MRSFSRWLFTLLGQASWHQGQPTTSAPLIVPVALVDRDYSDDDRASFFDDDVVAATPGQAGFGVLTPIGGDVEMVAAYFSGGAAINAQLLVEDVAIVLGSPPTLPSIVQQSIAGLSPPRGATVFGTSATTGTGSFEAPANQTTYLPVRGMIVSPGKCIAIRAGAVNQTFRVGFVWRNR